ncbi:PqiB family protein [Bordetella genomosp. 1]|uniref:Paraquat-inducible protein B n=1 Tax=Bordetella genomosp. 1 TaxID=1395607 RepID=A0ABX4F1N1_9BORD|nr:MlaD family protein [Bordetella genomosp. 1]OZI65903.1 paraquat-inducible protein B [Bordetella genomosp. 1]
MAEQTPPSGTPVHKVSVSKKERSHISWIWLVPLIAALAGVSLVVRSWLQSGPEITIQFESAEGLEVGKTQLRYKEVNIGLVQDIRLSEDRSKVLVQASLGRDVANLAREGTNFWVVRPRLGVSGVSGLGTLVSGAYIGVDAEERKPEKGERASKYDFVGLETPPAVTYDRQGKRFMLKAHDLGSLDIGSPVYYRRIGVGRVVGYKLDDSGKNVNVEIFIDAPNDKFVTAGTRFWNASGVDFSVNADGLKMRTQSLVSMAIGGIAFEDVSPRSSEAAPANSTFELYTGEGPAKANTDGEPFPVRMRFDQSVRGLSVGAPIDFQGITLGEVTKITIDFDSKTKRFFAMVDATLYPVRLGRIYDEVLEEAEKQGDGSTAPGHVMSVMVKYGLRAQMKSANLLTGQLFIVLDHFPKAPPVKYEPATPMPIPTIPGQFDQLQEQISSIVSKIEKIPFDQIGNELRVTLSNTSKLMGRLEKDVAPEAQSVLKQARQSLSAVNDLIASDSSLPVNTERAMQELSRAARSLRSLADFLQTNPEALLRGRGDDPIPGAGPVRN